MQQQQQSLPQLELQTQQSNLTNLSQPNLKLSSRKSEKEKEKESKINIRTKNINKYYKVVEEVGQGAYGRVYKARCLKTNNDVALKKFEPTDDKTIQNGFPITALREIKLLKQVNHQNVMKLKEIIVTKPSERNRYRGSTFMVFDYMHHDFAGLFKFKYEFDYATIKSIMQQILQGVEYLHKNNISHRDLKIANILLNNDGVVKITDFGLSRIMNSTNNRYTVKVVTLWYRAPELLLGMKDYTTKVDMWSVACIFAEFLCADNLLRGDCEMRQVEKIFELCGTPDDQSWPGHQKLPNFNDLKPRTFYKSKLEDFVLKKSYILKKLKEKNQSDDIKDALDFLKKIFALDPNQRLSAEQALQHPFFTRGEKPCKIQIEGTNECHEMQIQKERKGQKKQPNQQNNMPHNYQGLPEHVKAQQIKQSNIQYGNKPFNNNNYNNNQNINMGLNQFQQQPQQPRLQQQYSQGRMDFNNNQQFNKNNIQPQFNNVMNVLNLNKQKDQDSNQSDEGNQNQKDDEGLEDLLGEDLGSSNLKKRTSEQNLDNEDPGVQKKVQL